jgi:hypothetical protein
MVAPLSRVTEDRVVYNTAEYRLTYLSMSRGYTTRIKASNCDDDSQE